MRKSVVLGVAALSALAALAWASAIPREPAWREEAKVVASHPDFELVRTGEIEDANLSALSKDRIVIAEERLVYSALLDSPRFGPEHPLFIAPSGSIVARLRELVGRSRLVRRVRKVVGTTHAVILRTGTIIAFYGHYYRSSDGGETFEQITALPSEGALDVDKYAFSEPTPRNEIYFGELVFSDQPHPVRVYKGSDDGRTWELKHTFAPGETNHIHNIVYDAFRDRIWICTGDEAAESKLFYTDDDFRSVHLLGGGDQGWRITGLIVTKDALFWGCGGEPDGTHIYRYDFATQERRRIQDVENPIWYATQLADGTMALAGAYEPSIEYTKQKSPPKEAVLWISRDGSAWHKALGFAYRPEAQHLGLNGILGLSQANAHHSALYVSPLGPLEKSFTVQRYEVRWRRK